MRQCAVCNKGSRMGGARRLLRAHYNPVNWTRKYPNLQWGKIDGKRVKMCTTCIKSQHKTPRAKVARTTKAAV
jgi:ribosomal protein L28